MSIIADAPGKYSTTDFRGARHLEEETDQMPPLAYTAVNCQFKPGAVGTRNGFGEAYTAVDSCNSMFYYTHTDGVDYLISLRGGSKVVVRNLSTGTETTLLTGLGGVHAMRFVQFSGRIYFVGIDTNGNGAITGYVWNGNVASTPFATFQRPLLTTEISFGAVEGLNGVVTKGLHKFSIIASTKAGGYWTRPAPVDTSIILQEFSFTATGGGTLTVTVTPSGNWPAWVNSVQLLMTPVQNNFKRYLVPNSVNTNGGVGFGGTATPYTMVVNLSDAELRSNGTDNIADDYFDQICQSSAGTPPFYPKNICVFGDRVVWNGVYGGQDCFFPSDMLNPERITANEHLKTQPGVESVTAMVANGSSLFTFSPKSTLQWGDNGQKPVNWSKPAVVSDKLGAPGWSGVLSNVSNGYLLICNPSGLWKLSGGSYPDLPVSYLQKERWETIDWAFPLSVFIEEDPTNKNVLVRYFNKTGSHQIFGYNYYRGLNPKDVDFSDLTITGFNYGPIHLVRNPTKKCFELWIASADNNAKVLRQKSILAGDSNLFNDDSLGIDCRYQTCPLPPKYKEQILNYLGYMIRMFGSGSILMYGKSLDQVRTKLLVTQAITTTPGKNYHGLMEMQSESVSLLFSNNSVANTYFNLSALTVYFSQLTEHR